MTQVCSLVYLVVEDYCMDDLLLAQFSFVIFTARIDIRFRWSAPFPFALGFPFPSSVALNARRQNSYRVAESTFTSEVTTPE